jgi:hypothetical protein
MVVLGESISSMQRCWQQIQQQLSNKCLAHFPSSAAAVVGMSDL